MHTKYAASSLPTLDPPAWEIAVVGLRFGRSILNEISRKPNAAFFNVAGVCDFQKTLVAEAAEKFGVPGYHSLDELLERNSSPVIGLFTAPKGRAQLVRKIIRAGRDVVTTKPFELDSADARSVLEEARDLGRIIHLNSPAPVLAKDLQLIKDWQIQHGLGRPVGGSARVWASYQEQADGTWLDDPKTCPAAPLFRLGIYLLNDLNHVFGPAESLQLMTSSIRTGRPTPDNAQVNIKYRSGALGQVFASFCVEDGDQYQNSMVLNFEHGTIYRNAGGLRGTEDSEQTELVLVGSRQRSRRQIIEHTSVQDGSGSYQWAALAESMRTRSMGSDAFIGGVVEGVRLVDALQRAQESGSAHV